jgi:hypothetical protein
MTILQNKTALVTGASRGIGRAIASPLYYYPDKSMNFARIFSFSSFVVVLVLEAVLPLRVATSRCNFRCSMPYPVERQIEDDDENEDDLVAATPLRGLL